jgi:hypothetical protein
VVKIGFIVEGATEKIILEKSDLFTFLKENNIEFVPEIIDAEGNGNLLPYNIAPYTKALIDKGATKIFILTDLDEDQCITKTKKRIGTPSQHVICVSIKTIEAWFLADVAAIRNFLSFPDFDCATPEEVIDPFSFIKKLRLQHANRGVADKKILANLMIKSGFAIRKAAAHPYCLSAQYFLKKIIETT